MVNPKQMLQYIPASGCECNNGSCVLLEGGVHSCNGSRCRCVGRFGSESSNLLKDHTMEHGCLSLKTHLVHQVHNLHRVFACGGVEMEGAHHKHPCYHVPLAVSPDSMTQSAPSSTALATSLASALVGRGLYTMLSNI